MAVLRNPWKGFHWGGGPLRFPRSTIEALKNLVKDIFFRPPVLAHMVYDVHGPMWAPGNSTCCFALNPFHFFFWVNRHFSPKKTTETTQWTKICLFSGTKLQNTLLPNFDLGVDIHPIKSHPDSNTSPPKDMNPTEVWEQKKFSFQTSWVAFFG